jgi:serine protease AprX
MRGPAVIALAMFLALSSAYANQIISPELSERIATTEGDQFLRIKICVEHQLDLRYMLDTVTGMNKRDRREFVVNQLKSAAAKNHASVISLLEKEESVGNVRRVRSLWLANVVAAEVTRSVIDKLARSPSVVRIDSDPYEYALIDGPHASNPPPDNLSPAMPDTVWNLYLIDAPCAWQQGYTGQGIVVGHFDTGVNYTHVDLADHIWTNAGETPSNGIDDDGNGYVDDYYGYDFANTDSDPRDDNGHGTHTAGSVAGDGTAGRNTGVAPDARIMSLKVLDSGGSGAETDVWEAIQYSLDNGADVLTFSIGWLHFLNPDRASWRNAFNGVMLAGVSAAVAAGNERELAFLFPPPDNVRTPGDVPPPWLHPDQILTGGLSGVVTVGATDASDVIADFSSLGPVEWDTVAPWLDYPYNREDITSLDFNDSTGYISGWSGTSMACPHVAGLMALMLSKNPNVSPAEVDSITETTALELGSPGKDNDYGSGRIRVCDAINATPTGIEETPFARETVSRSFLRAVPNPFTAQVEITISLDAETQQDKKLPGSVFVYDLSGRVIQTLALPRHQDTRYQTLLTWDGADRVGMAVPSGIYFLKVATGRGVLTEKLVLIR